MNNIAASRALRGTSNSHPFVRSRVAENVSGSKRQDSDPTKSRQRVMILNE